METTSTLTATEVIDGVRAARERRACRCGTSAPARRPNGRCCTPAPRTPYPAGWGWTTLNDDGVIPLAGPGAPLVDQFAPASLGAALGITLDAAEAADRRRPGADLPTPPPLGPGRSPGWSRSGWPARSPGRPTTCPSRPSRTPTGSSARPPTRSARSTPPGWSTKRGCTSTPTAPSRTRITNSPSAASGSDTGGAPGHHRRVHDPGHPRRRALRPDHHAASPASSVPSATPTTSTSAEHGRSGSSPTRSTPWTSSPAATSAAPSTRPAPAR